MENPLDLTTSTQTTIPNALAELQKANENIARIALYCKQEYEKDPAFFPKTQSYIRDALSNVAYHLHTVGSHITNTLQLASNELDQLDIQLGVVKTRLFQAKSKVGETGIKTEDAVRNYKNGHHKTRTIPENELPVSSKPLKINTFPRIIFNLTALDQTGITLSGQKGQENFSLSVLPEEHQQVHDQSRSSSYTNLPYTPTPKEENLSSSLSAPPNLSAPPPSLSAPPPSFSAPPPSLSAPENDEVVPLPPNSKPNQDEDMDLPPPAVSDLPPPVDNSDLPPPPPDDLDLPPPPPMDE